MPARAVVNPLRGLTFDGTYVASVLGQIDGPIVLVGHSYGGPVMTYASSDAANVTALVYVASFGLDEGVSTNGSVEGFPPSDLPPTLRQFGPSALARRPLGFSRCRRWVVSQPGVQSRLMGAGRPRSRS